MKKNDKKLVIVLLSITLLISCNNTDLDIMQDGNNQSFATDNKQDNNVLYVPFFEVAKGDSIGKGIFRDKPIFSDDVKIEFSTTDETQTRGEGGSSGSGFILDLMTSVRANNTAEPTLTHDGITYYKIPIDLNEGAGGKYIYLYYAKTQNIYDGFNHIGSIISCCYPIFYASTNYKKLGISFSSGGWTDLNEGAGGDYIYLEGLPIRVALSNSFYPIHLNVITDIIIISLTKKLESNVYTDSYGNAWIIGTDDLNKGVGGKWIYLGFRVVSNYFYS